jgi:hypothetical protein
MLLAVLNRPSINKQLKMKAERMSHGTKMEALVSNQLQIKGKLSQCSTDNLSLHSKFVVSKTIFAYLKNCVQHTA